MSLSVSEVESILENHEFPWEYTRNDGSLESGSESGWNQWDDLVPYSDKKSDPVEVPSLGSVRMLHTYTGGEGGGESAEMVFEVTDANGGVRWFRLSGYYASYDGTTWDGPLSEVRPVERMVIFYE